MYCFAYKKLFFETRITLQSNINRAWFFQLGSIGCVYLGSILERRRSNRCRSIHKTFDLRQYILFTGCMVAQFGSCESSKDEKDRPCLFSMPHLVRLHKFRKFHILTDFAIYSTNTKKVMAVAFRYFNISIARQKCSEPPSPKRSIKADLKE